MGLRNTKKEHLKEDLCMTGMELVHDELDSLFRGVKIK